MLPRKLTSLLLRGNKIILTPFRIALLVFSQKISVVPKHTLASAETVSTKLNRILIYTLRFTYLQNNAIHVEEILYCASATTETEWIQVSCALQN